MSTRHSYAYLIVGDDPYLAGDALEKLVPDADQLSTVEFGPASPASSILEALGTPTMLGGLRYVVVKGADELSADSQRELIEYLEDPSPDAVLVLIAAKPVAKLASATKKVGRVIEAARGRRNELFGWVKEEARSRGMKVSGDAMGALVEAVGEERLALSNALDELSIASGKAALSPELVRKHFRGRADVKIFTFVDAVAMRDAGVALESLHRLIRQGEAPQALFWTLVRHFRMMLLVEGSPSKVARDLGLPSWRAEKLVKQARLFDRHDLVDAFRALSDADRKIKKSEEPDELALERAVVSIAGAG